MFRGSFFPQSYVTPRFLQRRSIVFALPWMTHWFFQILSIFGSFFILIFRCMSFVCWEDIVCSNFVIFYRHYSLEIQSLLGRYGNLTHIKENISKNSLLHLTDLVAEFLFFLQSVDATLYLVQAVSEYVEPNEESYIPAILSMLPRLPDNSYVSQTALLMVGTCC